MVHLGSTITTFIHIGYAKFISFAERVQIKEFQYNAFFLNKTCAGPYLLDLNRLKILDTMLVI